MKQVTEKKRRFLYKDVLRFVSLLAIHYISLYIYFVIICLIKLAIVGSFLPDLSSISGLVVYMATIAGSINTIIHIYYSEIGSSGFRMFMGIHCLFIIVMFPLALLFF